MGYVQIVYTPIPWAFTVFGPLLTVQQLHKCRTLDACNQYVNGMLKNRYCPTFNMHPANQWMWTPDLGTLQFDSADTRQVSMAALGLVYRLLFMPWAFLNLKWGLGSCAQLPLACFCQIQYADVGACSFSTWPPKRRFNSKMATSWIEFWLNVPTNCTRGIWGNRNKTVGQNLFQD